MNSDYKSRILICAECGEEFVFTAAAQEYFAERGYTEDPNRCKTCHSRSKKAARQARTEPSYSHVSSMSIDNLLEISTGSGDASLNNDGAKRESYILDYEGGGGGGSHEEGVKTSSLRAFIKSAPRWTAHRVLTIRIDDDVDRSDMNQLLNEIAALYRLLSNGDNLVVTIDS